MSIIILADKKSLFQHFIIHGNSCCSCRSGFAASNATIGVQVSDVTSSALRATHSTLKRIQQWGQPYKQINNRQHMPIKVHHINTQSYFYSALTCHHCFCPWWGSPFWGWHAWWFWTWGPWQQWMSQRKKGYCEVEVAAVFQIFTYRTIWSSLQLNFWVKFLER